MRVILLLVAPGAVHHGLDAQKPLSLLLYGLADPFSHTVLHVHIPRQTEASCFGTAILGAVAGGAYESIHAAAQSMVKYQSAIRPDAGNHRKYQFYLKKYEEAYVLMKDRMHEVSSYSLSHIIDTGEVSGCYAAEF